MSSRLAALPTLNEIQTTRSRANPKLATRLTRAIAKKAARLEDARKLRAWAFAVKERDVWKDRRTGQRVRRTRDLDPQRAEAHHIISRDDWAVRYDVRNGVTLSLESHELVELGKLRIVGTVWFTKHGVRYIDGRYLVRFVPA